MYFYLDSTAYFGSIMAESLKVKNALDSRLEHSISLLNDAENELEAGKKALKKDGKSPVDIAKDDGIMILKANVKEAQANMGIAKAISEGDKEAELKAVIDLRMAELQQAELCGNDLLVWQNRVTYAQNKLSRFEGTVHFCHSALILTFWYFGIVSCVMMVPSMMMVPSTFYFLMPFIHTMILLLARLQKEYNKQTSKYK